MSKTQITAEPGIPQIIIEREFDAPRDLVFRAYTDPELIVQWLGPRELTTRIEEYDVRDGGRWRYVSTDAEGNEYGFHGLFHGTPSPDGTVETLTLDERDGRTLVRTVSSFQSVEDRDGMVEAGMEHGVHDSHERLTELLATMRAR
jgi:uncharacterized protein YndB with AHSA1/START domain